MAKFLIKKSAHRLFKYSKIIYSLKSRRCDIILALYFFPGVILSTFFLFLLIYGGLGLGFKGWRLLLGFWGWGFQLMGFGACGVEPSGFFGYGALHINIKE